MSRRIRVVPEAAAELEAAATWYEEQEPGAGLGHALLQAVSETYALLEEGLHGTPVPGAKTAARRLPVARFPFWVVFLELSDEVVVVAFAHEKRRPGYWRGRGHAP